MSMTEQGLNVVVRSARRAGAGQRVCGRRATRRPQHELAVREPRNRLSEPWRLTDSPTLARLKALGI